MVTCSPSGIPFINLSWRVGERHQVILILANISDNKTSADLKIFRNIDLMVF